MSTDSVKAVVPCAFCGRKIELVMYQAQSGKWIGAIHCSNCRYKWIGHGNGAEEVRASLSQGGDLGGSFAHDVGSQVMWEAKRKDKEYVHGGEVIALLAPGVDPEDALVLCETEEVKGWQKMFRRWGKVMGEDRKSLSHFRRYLVKQRENGKKKPRYYAPRASSVEAYMDRMAGVGLAPAVQQLAIDEGSTR